MGIFAAKKKAVLDTFLEPGNLPTAEPWKCWDLCRQHCAAFPLLTLLWTWLCFDSPVPVGSAQHVLSNEMLRSVCSLGMSTPQRDETWAGRFSPVEHSLPDVWHFTSLFKILFQMVLWHQEVILWQSCLAVVLESAIRLQEGDLSVLLFYFILFFFYWSIVDLQCCVTLSVLLAGWCSSSSVGEVCTVVLHT